MQMNAMRALWFRAAIAIARARLHEPPRVPSSEKTSHTVRSAFGDARTIPPRIGDRRLRPWYACDVHSPLAPSSCAAPPVVCVGTPRTSPTNH